MSWVQVKSPNLNVQTSMGMCLKYVQDAYGSGWAGSYALQGWRDIVKKKHANRNIPGGVYVPIWFEGYWNGVNYGHVAIYKDGVCWSSPYTNKRSHDRLGSIHEVERIYGMKYIGWSEDIGGTIVITKEDAMSNDNVNQLFQAFWRRNANTSEHRKWAGKPATELINVLTKEKAWKDTVKIIELGTVAKKGNWEKRLLAFEASKSSKGTTLKPGTYIVK